MKYFPWLLLISMMFIFPSCDKEDDFSGAISMPDIMPAFPGGVEKMYIYFYGKLKYPAEARENGVSGTVVVTFVVNKSGKIGDIRTLTSLGSGLEDEVMRVMTLMSHEIQWIPGTKNGEPVNVFFTLPVKFVL